MRILVVEDEPDICESIAEGLALDGYAVDTCNDGEEAYAVLFAQVYDLVILDLNLPGMDGLEVLQAVQAANSTCKFLILSARSSIEDRVKGLQAGACDYLTKPFAFAELEARVSNLLRRRFVQEDVQLQLDALTLDTQKRQASVGGTPLALTNKELGILEYLMLHPDEIISKEELIEHVWNNEADEFSNAIRVHIATLRKKLLSTLGYEILQTKIGAGYYLQSGGTPL